MTGSKGDSPAILPSLFSQGSIAFEPPFPPVGGVGHEYSRLGEVRFGADPDESRGRVDPSIRVDLPPLGGEGGVFEVWGSRRPVTRHRSGPFRWAEDGEILFGAATLSPLSIGESAFDAYQAMVTTIRQAGYPHLIRVWNHFPGINDLEQGVERYRQFCVGRFRAFERMGYRLESDLPAASAIGSPRGGFALYFIAAVTPGRSLENPRQVSAYRYPPRYSPRSPSFSRAMRHGNRLFISGTASILGHETVHIGDLAGQCEETLTNIRALCSPLFGAESLSRQSGCWRVYLKDSAFLAQVAHWLREALGPRASILYLQGDICRSDLLLEIEGVIDLT